ncbi:F-box family protein, partial [Trifolium medium]|nr:F-box family protein [Trifolium medium]
MMFLTGCPMLQDLHSSDVDFDSMESLTCNEWKDFLLSNLTRANIDCHKGYFPVKAVHNVPSLRFYYRQRYYHNDFIPTFYNLTQLELLCSDYSKEFILDVLNHCPKLQRLD